MSREAESAGGAEGFEVWGLLLQVGEARKVCWEKDLCAGTLLQVAPSP